MQAYLERPLIPNVRIVISNEVVEVSTPSTCYCKIVMPKKLVQRDILDTYANIMRVTKQKRAEGINLRVLDKRKVQWFVQDKWSLYRVAYQELTEHFKLLQAQAEVVRKRGVHSGTSDDEELDKLIRLTWEWNVHCGSIVAQMSEIACSLNNIYRDVCAINKETYNFTDYTLYL